MKHYCIIISLLLGMANGTPAFCQGGLNDSLMKLELAYYRAPNDSMKEKILAQKIGLLLRSGNTGTNTFQEFKRLKPSLLPQQDYRNLFWNGAIVSYLNGENNYADFFIHRFASLGGDTGMSWQLLNALIHKQSDSSQFYGSMNYLRARDSSAVCLTCFQEITRYERKHKNAYLIASGLLPGSGTMANGEVLKGSVSLLVNAASVFGVVKLAQAGLYVNAVLWGSGLGAKFYTGNLNLTYASFHKKEDRTRRALSEACEANVGALLKKYPIALLD